jgi:hypothetical protein
VQCHIFVSYLSFIVKFYATYLFIVKVDITVFSWYYNVHNSEAPNSFHGLFIKGVLNSRDTSTATEKYSRLYRPINLFTFRIYYLG